MEFIHGGPRVTDASTGLIYFNHTPTQEVEDWLSAWADKGDKPVMANEFSGAPMNVDFAKGNLAFATEYGARLLGDRAYAEETDEYVHYAAGPCLRGLGWDYEPFRYSPTLVPLVAEAHERTMRTWRYYGAPFLGWVFRTAKSSPGDLQIFAQYEKMIKPTLVWLGGPPARVTEKDHSYFSGERVEKSLVVVRDLLETDRWQVSWRVHPAGQQTALAQGSFERLPGPYLHEAWPISFTAPAATAPEQLEVSLYRHRPRAERENR